MRKYPNGPLFQNEGLWNKYEALRCEWLGREVAQYDDDRLLNTPPDALKAYFVEKFSLALPVLDEANISVADREVSVPAPSSHIWTQPRTSPPGTEYEFHVPFSGDAELFHVTPMRCSRSPPEAQVQENLLVHRLVGRDLSAHRVDMSFRYFVESVNRHLRWLGYGTDAWNATLPAKVERLIEGRRQKLLRDRETVASLGFKVRQRPGASQTYAPPEVRRKVTPNPPPATGGGPEPALDIATYEHILKVLSDGAVLMERSPAAFRTMNEEDIRTVLLVLLNGHYEGQATGETFNYGGKTDILVRVGGRNVFTGECKLWGGPKALTETIDQVLGYTAWRDTKAAVIVFNRNKGFARVLAQVRPAVEEHPNCKAFVSEHGESQFRFIFRHRDDPNREMTLTVLLFDVPTP